MYVRFIMYTKLFLKSFFCFHFGMNSVQLQVHLSVWKAHFWFKHFIVWIGICLELMSLIFYTFTIICNPISVLSNYKDGPLFWRKICCSSLGSVLCTLDIFTFNTWPDIEHINLSVSDNTRSSNPFPVNKAGCLSSLLYLSYVVCNLLSVSCLERKDVYFEGKAVVSLLTISTSALSINQNPKLTNGYILKSKSNYDHIWVCRMHPKNVRIETSPNYSFLFSIKLGLIWVHNQGSCDGMYFSSAFFVSPFLKLMMGEPAALLLSHYIQ